MTQPAPEWFAHSDGASGEAGLRFSCTLCGNCCSGPEGYVLVSDAEAEALSGLLGVSREAFLAKFTRATIKGRSLVEKVTPHGQDCVFLDRDRVPGRAICSVYEARPAQCRTWPFWPSNLRTREAWERARRVCPGMGTGTLRTVQQIRVQRDAFEI